MDIGLLIPLCIFVLVCAVALSYLMAERRRSKRAFEEADASMRAECKEWNEIKSPPPPRPDVGGIHKI